MQVFKNSKVSNSENVGYDQSDRSCEEDKMISWHPAVQEEGGRAGQAYRDIQLISWLMAAMLDNNKYIKEQKERERESEGSAD